VVRVLLTLKAEFGALTTTRNARSPEANSNRSGFSVIKQAIYLTFVCVTRVSGHSEVLYQSRVCIVDNTE